MENISDDTTEFARTLLLAFVKDIGEIYGKYNIVHNIHALIHLPDDVKQFGSLDSFSAFPFENKMSEWKSLIRKKNQPLAQIYNRISELNIVDIVQTAEESKKLVLMKPRKLRQRTIYTAFKYKNFEIDRTEKNRWLLTKSHNILKFQRFEKVNGEGLIYANELKEKENLFDYPITSEKLGIYITSSSTEEEPSYWNIDTIESKLFLMVKDSARIFVPLIHTMSQL